MCCLWVILFVKKLRNPPIQSPPTVTTEKINVTGLKMKFANYANIIWFFFTVFENTIASFQASYESKYVIEKNPPFHARNFSSQCVWFNSLSIMTHDWNRASYIYRKRISSGDIYRNTFPNWNWLQAPKAQSHTLNHAIHKQTKLRISLIYLF